MKKIEPIGRSIESTIGADFEAVPHACQCSSWSAFTGARGLSHDDCDHCGCQCDTLIHKIANRNNAKNTNRKS